MVEDPPLLDRFDRVVLVGEGARTRTYAATRGPSSPFAVRMLRPGVDPALVRRAFARGASAVLGQAPPHVELAAGRAFFVAPLIVGEALSRRPATPMPPRLATRIAIEIARTLDNRVHGDLHPRHVLFSADGRAQLIDPDPAASGPTGYLAPERRHGRPASVTSEVYALGVLWLELMTGNRPDASTRASSPPGAARVPEPAQWLTRRLLRSEPRDRIRDLDAARSALDDLLDRLPGPDPSIRAWLGEAPWRRVGFWKDAWRALTEGGRERTLVEGELVSAQVRWAASPTDGPTAKAPESAPFVLTVPDARPSTMRPRRGGRAWLGLAAAVAVGAAAGMALWNGW
jgi:hypothetical protein